MLVHKSEIGYIMITGPNCVTSRCLIENDIITQVSLFKLILEDFVHDPKNYVMEGYELDYFGGAHPDHDGTTSGSANIEQPSHLPPSPRNVENEIEVEH